jgi:hypothetical protein
MKEDSISLEMWLSEWWDKGRNCMLPPIFFPNIDAGPDIVLALVKIDPNDEILDEISFALIQVKLKNMTGYAEAARTVNPDLVASVNRKAKSDRKTADDSLEPKKAESATTTTKNAPQVEESDKSKSETAEDKKKRCKPFLIFWIKPRCSVS